MFPVTRGTWFWGVSGQTAVVALAGRSHLYEGGSMPCDFSHTGACRLGVKSCGFQCIGGINPRFRSGQVVLIDQHIDAMRRYLLFRRGTLRSVSATLEKNGPNTRGSNEIGHRSA